jgi:hypothetical protein
MLHAKKALGIRSVFLRISGLQWSPRYSVRHEITIKRMTDNRRSPKLGLFQMHYACVARCHLDALVNRLNRRRYHVAIASVMAATAATRDITLRGICGTCHAKGESCDSESFGHFLKGAG